MTFSDRSKPTILQEHSRGASVLAPYAEVEMACLNRQRSKSVHTPLFAGLLTVVLVASTAVPALAGTAASGTFALTGSLNTVRYSHSATLLPSGEVLVNGGLGVNGVYTSLASAELYDPKKGKWTVTGSMSVGRAAFTATNHCFSDSGNGRLRAFRISRRSSAERPRISSSMAYRAAIRSSASFATADL